MCCGPLHHLQGQLGGLVSKLISWRSVLSTEWDQSRLHSPLQCDLQPLAAVFGSLKVFHGNVQSFLLA